MVAVYSYIIYIAIYIFNIIIAIDCNHSIFLPLGGYIEKQCVVKVATTL